MSWSYPMTAFRTAHNPRDIGRRIEAIMKALGLSQAQFSRLTGVSQQALNNYLQGRQRPQLDQAVKICIRTGATLDWIYFGDPSGLPQKLTPPAA
jgi:transcriptional regulator with XRE-family HTH domain